MVEVGNPSVRLCEIRHDAASCGFNLTKSKWDPYPWVSTVDSGSPAAIAGVLPGDCLLEVNGEDMLGLRVAEVAARVKARGDRATVMLWNSGVDSNCTSETLCCGPMPNNLQRLTTCMSSIIEALECPICLETIPPPAHQCANGHLICLNCRARTERCPVCRMRFFRGRSLLADQVFDSMIDAFDLRKENETERSKLLIQKVYGQKKKERSIKPEIKINFLSPTNKFLTRIMGSGKSSSVENLSRELSDAIPCFDENFSGLKTKSLSSNEIFRAESLPASRTSSILSNRPGSGLLNVSALHHRPASYHGSAEDLLCRLMTDFDLDIRHTRERAYPCPLKAFCQKQVKAMQLKAHLMQHNIPIIQFSEPEVTVKLSWLEDAILIIECHNSVFLLRLVSGEKLCIWNVGDSNAEFTTSVNCEGSSTTCNVTPLSDLENNDIGIGVPFHTVYDKHAKVTVKRSSQVLLVREVQQRVTPLSVEDTKVKVVITKGTLLTIHVCNKA